MRDDQWQSLVELVSQGSTIPRIGLLVDSPWLPGWYGITIREYLASERLWLQANLKAVEEFPDVWFIPGFWSEYGMCTEPSAFGGRCRFGANDFPHIEPMLSSWDEVPRLTPPDCTRDGLLPFVIERLKLTESEMVKRGHRVRFAVSRGPLNIGSYLLGQSEFLLGLKAEKELAHRLLRLVTDFIKSWIQYQRETFSSIDGLLILDDLIGFVGPKDFEEFVVPYFTEIFSSVPVSVRMLHNDAYGLITARYLAQMKVNVFNFSCDHSFAQLRELCGPDVILMGNIKPRDVLAGGTIEDLRRDIRQAWDTAGDRTRILWSAGGGVPPNVSSEKIRTFCEELKSLAQNSQP